MGADGSPVALVTGGSRGIGRAVVERLAARGLQVVFSYKSNADAATALVDALRAKGQVGEAAQVDARSLAASAALVDRIIAERGRIDVLVNNAGITADKLIANMTESDWTSVLETSLNGLFGPSKPAARQMMRQRSGRIVNLTSVSGLIGIAGQTNYSAAKAAIIGFTRSLAKEMAPWGVPVNAVAPGFVDTDMLGSFTPAQRTAALARVPMRRFAAADEIAGLIEYLVLDSSTYLTGQTLVVDGGLAS